MDAMALDGKPKEPFTKKLFLCEMPIQFLGDLS